MTALGGIAGIVLAGGEGRRIGGDKPFRLLAGRPLLDHVLARLKSQADRLALNANGDPARFARWGLPVLPDGPHEGAGPLAGVLAGMRWAGEEGAILTVAADMPFLPPDLVMRLKAGQRGATIVCAASAGRLHPVVGLWPVSLADELGATLAAGLRRVEDFARSHPLSIVEFAPNPADPFFNVNDAADLALAEALLRNAGNALPQTLPGNG